MKSVHTFPIYLYIEYDFPVKNYKLVSFAILIPFVVFAIVFFFLVIVVLAFDPDLRSFSFSSENT